MDNASSDQQRLSSAAGGKFQPWVAFSRKEDIPSQFMVGVAKPKNAKEGDPAPGSAGEVNRDIEYDTDGANEAHVGDQL